jgi:hypothetical protein
MEEWGISALLTLSSVLNIDSSTSTRDRHTLIEQLKQASLERPYVQRYLMAWAPLAKLSISELRSVAREWQIDVSNCLEKGEILHRLVESGGGIHGPYRRG